MKVHYLNGKTEDYPNLQHAKNDLLRVLGPLKFVEIDSSQILVLSQSEVEKPLWWQVAVLMFDSDNESAQPPGTFEYSAKPRDTLTLFTKALTEIYPDDVSHPSVIVSWVKRAWYASIQRFPAPIGRKILLSTESPTSLEDCLEQLAKKWLSSLGNGTEVEALRKAMDM